MPENEDLLRKICDKRSLDAFNILKSINPDKAKALEQNILSFFRNKNVQIDFEIYSDLVKNLDLEQSISYQRKKDIYDLDEITDI
jgi:hypothetical protein